VDEGRRTVPDDPGVRVKLGATAATQGIALDEQASSEGRRHYGWSVGGDDDLGCLESFFASLLEAHRAAGIPVELGFPLCGF